MKKILWPIICLLGVMLLLSGCNSASETDSSSSQGSVDSSSSVLSSDQSGGQNNTSSLTLEDAKAVFMTHHPESAISVAKLEGKVYYIEGWNGNILSKMKIRAADGEIVFNETIQTGRPN